MRESEEFMRLKQRHNKLRLSVQGLKTLAGDMRAGQTNMGRRISSIEFKLLAVELALGAFFVTVLIGHFL